MQVTFCNIFHQHKRQEYEEGKCAMFAGFSKTSVENGALNQMGVKMSPGWLPISSAFGLMGHHTEMVGNHCSMPPTALLLQKVHTLKQYAQLHIPWLVPLPLNFDKCRLGWEFECLLHIFQQQYFAREKVKCYFNGSFYHISSPVVPLPVKLPSADKVHYTSSCTRP